MYITPEVNMMKDVLINKFGMPDDSQARTNRIAQLRAMKEERNWRRTIAITANEDIKAITNTLEENFTTINKLELANQILRESRDLFIKDTRDKFEQDNPFPEGAELEQLEKNEAAETVTKYGYGVNTSIGQSYPSSLVINSNDYNQNIMRM